MSGGAPAERISTNPSKYLSNPAGEDLDDLRGLGARVPERVNDSARLQDIGASGGPVYLFAYHDPDLSFEHVRDLILVCMLVRWSREYPRLKRMLAYGK